MARYNHVVITDAGQAILFRAIAGAYSIRFTAMAFGAGEHAADENLAAMTALDNERQRVSITDAAAVSEDSIVVKARVDNAQLLQGYYIREIGIYCDNADDNDSDETLYAVVTAAIPDYMTEGSQDAAPMEFAFQFALGVGSAGEVTIAAGGNGYYTQAEVDALLANYYTKAQVDALLSST